MFFRKFACHRKWQVIFLLHFVLKITFTCNRLYIKQQEIKERKMSERKKTPGDYSDEYYNKEDKAIADFSGSKEETELSPENTGKNLEFLKGILFGIMLSAICGMAWFLIENGTVGFRVGDHEEEAQGASSLTSAKTAEKLKEIADRIESSFLYDADGEKLTAYMLKGLTVGLEDPYANYYTEDEVKTIMELNEGEYYGIGITILQNAETGNFWIVGVYEGSPAWEAGLQTNDEIIEVDGEIVAGMDLTSLVAMIRQKKEVTVKVQREEKELDFFMELTDVEIPTVSWEMLEDQIGYLKITEFDSITVEQFENAVTCLKEQGMEKLILDVRDNPGGILDSVCDILDDLLPEGLIVYTEDREGNRQEYKSDKEQIYDGPVAVLVNGNSASASEIFAGSIQDYGLGPVIGTTTYGKGVVQRTYLLGDGSALKLTVEKYYTAGGQDIDGNGITPDYVVEKTEENAGQDTEYAEENGKKDGENDLQLQRAIDYLAEECFPLNEK